MRPVYAVQTRARVMHPPRDAFFLLPALRGVREDLIVLKYLQSIPAKERGELVSLLMSRDVLLYIKFQNMFFAAARPQQSVPQEKTPTRRSSSSN